MNPPKIDNAPGLVWRPCKAGWQARWRARADLAARGFTPKNVRIWASTAAQPEPSETAVKLIQDECNKLQSEMLVWGRGGIPVSNVFDGTLKSLADCYRTDADSTYRKVRFATRGYYDRLLGKLITEHGHECLQDIKARQFYRWHEAWSDNGKKLTMGHSMIGMVRTLVNFGNTLLEDPECKRLADALSGMKFAQGKPRTSAITAEQVTAFRKEAHNQGFPSIALAQAFQFELMLRQKDVIGEWVPISEPGNSEILSGNSKWLRGIRWNEIDADLTLRHVTSKRQKEIEVSLRGAPMVMEELALMGERPTSGPVVVCENTNRPWGDNNFRARWRLIATACGIPKTVRNMDSRAGAITEATNAGAELEHVRHAATHGDIQMTQRYSRGDKEKTASVQLKRVAHRNRTAT